jgi:L-alanine-DL-glutamate epimerase-like enolase superfamily enzyme
MLIARIHVTHHHLPLDPPLRASWDPRPRAGFDTTIVRVETDDGLVGIGSGGAMPGFAGHEELFIGRDPRDLERHFQVLDTLSLHYGRCWPLDLALWDLIGKLTGQPCWRLLGGARSELRLYASAVVARSPEAWCDLAEQIVAAGFEALEVRLAGPDWRRELAGLEAIRRAVGDVLTLLIDTGRGWRMPWNTRPPLELKDAVALAVALEELNVCQLSAPLHRGDLAGLAELRARTRLRIAGGGLARELHDLEAMMAHRAVDVLQPDAALTGGITGLARVARSALACGIAFAPHTWGNGITLLANAQLAAGVGAGPLLAYPYDPDGWTPDRRDFPLAEPIGQLDGILQLSETPGLGIELDEERLRATRLD